MALTPSSAPAAHLTRTDHLRGSLVLDAQQLEKLSSIIGNSGLAEVVGAFLKEAQGLPRLLHDALKSRDDATLGRLAHSTKSAAAQLGLPTRLVAALSQSSDALRVSVAPVTIQS